MNSCKKFTLLGQLRENRVTVDKAARFSELIFSKKLDPNIRVYSDMNETAHANRHEKYMNLHLDFNDPTIHVHEFIHMLDGEGKDENKIKDMIKNNFTIYVEGRAKFMQELYRKLEREKYEIANKKMGNDFDKREHIIDEYDKKILIRAKEFEPKLLPKIPKDYGNRIYLTPDEDRQSCSILKHPITWIKYYYFYKKLRNIAIKINDCVKAFEITTNKVPGLFGYLFPMIYYRKEIKQAKQKLEFDEHTIKGITFADKMIGVSRWLPKYLTNLNYYKNYKNNSNDQLSFRVGDPDDIEYELQQRRTSSTSDIVRENISQRLLLNFSENRVLRDKLVLVGGSAIVHKYGMDRKTFDLDFRWLEKPDNKTKAIVMYEIKKLADANEHLFENKLEEKVKNPKNANIDKEKFIFDYLLEDNDFSKLNVGEGPKFKINFTIKNNSGENNVINVEVNEYGSINPVNKLETAFGYLLVDDAYDIYLSKLIANRKKDKKDIDFLQQKFGFVRTQKDIDAKKDLLSNTRQ
jgi:hypothetical protein